MACVQASSVFWGWPGKLLETGQKTGFVQKNSAVDPETLRHAVARSCLVVYLCRP